MLRFKVPMLAAGLLALTACGSDADVVFIDDGEAAGEDLGADLATTTNPFAEGPSRFVEPEDEFSFMSPEEMEADFQRRAHSSLTDAERLKVEGILNLQGIAPGDVALVGRLILDDHVYTDAEDLLSLPDELDGVVSKGRVTSSFIPTTTGTPGGATQESAASTIFARMNGATFQFFRPYLQHTVAYIVPQNDFLFTQMRTFTQSINDAGNDCLTGGASGTLRAGTMANYLALDGNARARLTRISVIIGDLETACPGASTLVGGANVKGCSLAPRRMGILHPDGVFRHTMAVGSRIGLVDTAMIPQDATSRRIATHELLHTLGVSHPNISLLDGTDQDTLPDALQVPGTSTNANVLSVMQNSCSPGTNCGVASPPACCSNVATSLSPDDVDVVDTLYSPQPGGNCNYIDDFQTIVAN